MNDWLALALYVLAILTPLLAAVITLAVWNRSRRHHKNPLTANLRRPPGGTLHRMFIGANFDQVIPLMVMAIAVLLPVSIHFFQSYVLGRPESLLRTLALVLMILLFFAYGVVGIWRARKRLNALGLGFECELAVGQTLDQLMLKGFRVYHDLLGVKFNIDHVVVGPAGVFAVETKGRTKLLGSAGKGKANPKVTYEGGVFRFPWGDEKDWAGQAQRQSVWLKNQLSKAVGFDLYVQPVIVVPGWFVESKSLDRVRAIGSGQIEQFFSSQMKRKLSEQQVQQIAYQLEQRTADLEPGEIRKPLEDSFK